MPVWIVYLLLTVLAAAAIAGPLWLKYRGGAATGESAGDEPAGGDLSPATGLAPPIAARVAVGRTPILVGAGVIAVLVAATALFLATGEPTPTPIAAVPTLNPAAGTGLPDVDTLIGRLASRLEAAPNDPEGWRMLGWSYFETAKYPQAVSAYARAVALAPGDAGFQSAYGEAQVKVAGDIVTPAAARAFRAALAVDPKDERARLYMARLRETDGDAAGALNDLFAILETAAADSRVAPGVRKEIRRIAKDSGINVSGRLPPEPKVAAEAAPPPPPGDQQAMVSGMVAGLEARLASSPRDIDGWIMLMRSRKMLGQDDLARAARDKALAVFSDDAAAKVRLTSAARDLGVS